MIDQIRWLGNSSFLIEGEPVIYINPWRITTPAVPADLILIGSDAHTACSPADIAKVRQPHTRVIGLERAGSDILHFEALRPFQAISFGRVSIKATPAYGDPAAGRTAAQDELGFVISINFHDIYYTGNTAYCPEMASLKPDIVLLPVSATGLMSPEQAAKVVDQLRPRYAVPYNWSAVSRVSALQFQQQAGATANVVLMQPATSGA